ncbi:hypothetical protein B0H14DRAFT_1636473 [Mycena olivaceomarginata]|nr:hypothetical protein B0H14DRAFT_1636473 [Mycena olivaceomarginata]
MLLGMQRSWSCVRCLSCNYTRPLYYRSSAKRVNRRGRGRLCACVRLRLHAATDARATAANSSQAPNDCSRASWLEGGGGGRRAPRGAGRGCRDSPRYRCDCLLVFPNDTYSHCRRMRTKPKHLRPRAPMIGILVAHSCPTTGLGHRPFRHRPEILSHRDASPYQTYRPLRASIPFVTGLHNAAGTFNAADIAKPWSSGPCNVGDVCRDSK